MWEGVRDRTELQHIDPHSNGHQHFLLVLQGCSTRGPGTQLSAGYCFLHSIISPSLLIPKISLNFLCTDLYNSSTLTQYLSITGHRNMHFRRLWNGMFDRHRAEITVLQFTGPSLPVHQFVTVPWDFNPVPYCQPSSPTPMKYKTSAVFGMACLAGSGVNILQYLVVCSGKIYGHGFQLFLREKNNWPNRWINKLPLLVIEKEKENRPRGGWKNSGQSKRFGLLRKRTPRIFKLIFGSKQETSSVLSWSK